MSSSNMTTEWEKNPAIQNFREYLKIPTVHPNVNYEECVKFLKTQAAGLGLAVRVYECVPRKPIVLMTWEGTQPTLPSILLNSHTDVVPVFEKSWTHPPFSAHMDSEGRIYARGAQDMKSVGVQYLEAVRELKAKGMRLKRTIHLSFVPDEEMGGADGMKKWVHTEDFKSLNVGFALDEGMASPGDDYVCFYAERSVWHVHIHVTGQPGHGSLLLPNNAGEKLRYLIDKFMDMRSEQKRILDADPNLTIGDVTTVNLTQINGGVQSNVVPEEIVAVFDMRLAIDVDHEAMEAQIARWCEEAGVGVRYEFEQKNPSVPATRTDSTNPYWVAFKAALDSLGAQVATRVFPAGTDSRYVRRVGVSALGFSPMRRTPVLLHDHDEHLSASVFLEGIQLYTHLIPALANL